MNHIENHTMQWLLLLFHIEHFFFVISKIIVICRKMQWPEHGFINIEKMLIRKVIIKHYSIYLYIFRLTTWIMKCHILKFRHIHWNETDCTYDSFHNGRKRELVSIQEIVFCSSLTVLHCFYWKSIVLLICSNAEKYHLRI